MKLSGEQFGRLHSVVLARFSASSLKLFLRVHCGQDLGRIAGAGQGLDDVALDVIGHAEREVWILTFVEHVHRQFPDDLEAAALYGELKAMRRAAGGADPYGTRWLGSGVPFLGRQEARRILKDLRASPSPSPICVVDGGQKSGKTFTTEFIRFLRQTPPAFEVIVLKLKDRTDEPLEELARSIALQIGLDASTMPSGVEQPARWARTFADWLVGQLRARATQLWIVLDECRDFVREDTKALIHELARVAARDLDTVRLILLHYEAKELPAADDIARRVKSEVIGEVGREELADFLTSMYEERNAKEAAPLPEEALAPRIVDSVVRVEAAVQARSDPDEPRMVVLQREAAREAIAILEGPWS